MEIHMAARRKRKNQSWKERIENSSWYNPHIPIEHYRQAIQFGWETRRRIGKVPFSEVKKELANIWAVEHATDGSMWNQVAPAVEDAWNEAEILDGDAVANKGGFKKPPTFVDNGTRTPRNVDESNW
jgi:hypothetical protein